MASRAGSAQAPIVRAKEAEGIEDLGQPALRSGPESKTCSIRRTRYFQATMMVDG